MEPSPLTSLNTSVPVDVKIVTQKLREIAETHELLNFKVTNMETLECMTADLIRDVFAKGEDIMDVVSNLMDLWFPALSKACDSWEHYWDVDLEIQAALITAGYPDVVVETHCWDKDEDVEVEDEDIDPDISSDSGSESSLPDDE